MAQGDLARTRASINGLNWLATLRDVNAKIQIHQLRLATGKRINHAGGDPAGLSIATKLSSRGRMLDQVFDNVGDARNLLSTVDGGLQSVNDLLVDIKANIVRSANDTLGTDGRQAITAGLIQLRDEINSITDDVTYNGVKLLGSNTELNFQTGETSQTTYDTASYTVADLGMSNLAALSSTDVIDSDNYQTYLDEVTAAISTVSSGLTDAGALSNRFDIKDDVIYIQQANTEAALSRIMDTDIAEEQLQLIKARIAQKANLAFMAQVNLNMEAILELFR